MKTLAFTFLTMLLLATFCFAGDEAKTDEAASDQPAKTEQKATAEKKAMTEEKATAETEAGDKPELKQAKAPEIITTESGLRYQELRVGEGVECTDGMKVDCHYILWFADSTGLKKTQMVQSSKDAGRSLKCTIGVGLIEGWSEGMIGMKEGGVRRLYVPWELGYGAAGRPGGIPPKQNLIFEIDFLSALEGMK